MRTLGLSLALAVLLVLLLPPAESAQENGLASRVAELEAQVAAMEEILEFVYVETEEINGLRGPHFIIEGANVHIRSGLGQTYPRGCPGGRPDGCVSTNSLGNLIVGYNELDPTQPTGRVGMHNLVVGPEHDYAISHGGFVAGFRNRIQTIGASVTGGAANQALNAFSSVSGGENREAPGEFNWVAGSLLEPN
jgi:hypothetical protein